MSAPAEPFGFACPSKEAGKVGISIYTGNGLSVYATMTVDAALELAERIRHAVASLPRTASAADLGLEAA